MTWIPTATPNVRYSGITGRADKPGPYVFALQLDEGARLTPRRPSDSRTIRVVSGLVLVGFGDSFDVKQLKPLVPGSSVVVEANRAYFAKAVQASVIHVSGTGPAKTTLVGEDLPVGGATPEATWLAARSAYGAGEFAMFAGLTIPAARGEIFCDPCVTMLFGAIEGGPLGEPEMVALDAIARRHRTWLTDRWKPGEGSALCSPEGASHVPDKVPLFVELMEYLRAKRVGPTVPAYLLADLEDLSVDGASASARVMNMKKVAFVRTEDGWFISWPAPSCFDDPVWKKAP